MCGIAGFLHFEKERAVDTEVIKSMAGAISYRGPDGEGFYINKNLAFGHRRLSVIDLSTGDQPMFSDDKNLVLIFNGEIYNYIELREELVKYGHQFKTNSDTEVIIKSYQEWGIDCQNRFNGMWAFALWDNNKQQLLLSRDRIGEKPLHYTVFDNTLIFGSELKCIFAYGAPMAPNLELVELYLSLGYIPAPYSFYKNVHKLEAGHCLIVCDANIRDYQYWDLPEIDERRMLNTKNEIFDRFEDLFTDSVRIRMRSDVPYGAFLSGGLDSSSIVSIMSGVSSYPIETFTIGFKEKAYDERDLARTVALKFGTNHHEHIVEPASFEELLDKMVHHYDEPFGDSSAIPTGYVSRFASAKVKMVLTGDGGDELLSGYPSYQHEKFASKYQKLPGWFRTSLPSALAFIPKPKVGSVTYKLKRAQIISHSSNLNFEHRFLYKDTCIDLPIIKQMSEGQKVYPIEEYLNSCLKKCTYSDPFYKLMYLNLKLTLPNDMLVKVDRMSMAYSLETRAPFLDHRLIEFMVHVHKDVKMQRFERKTILRKTIGKSLPPALLNAPKKGFAVPLQNWFKDDSFAGNLDALDKSMPYVNSKVVASVIQSNKLAENNYGNFIWMLLVLNKTCKQ